MSQLRTTLAVAVSAGAGSAMSPPDAHRPAPTRAGPTVPRPLPGREDNAVNQSSPPDARNLGYAVDVAENGRDARRRGPDERFEAVLMDCQMPVMDGYEATGEIRRDGARRSGVRRSSR